MCFASYGGDPRWRLRPWHPQLPCLGPDLRDTKKSQEWSVRGFEELTDLTLFSSVGSFMNHGWGRGSGRNVVWLLNWVLRVQTHGGVGGGGIPGEMYSVSREEVLEIVNGCSRWQEDHGEVGGEPGGKGWVQGVGYRILHEMDAYASQFVSSLVVGDKGRISAVGISGPCRHFPVGMGPLDWDHWIVQAGVWVPAP